MGNKSGFGRHHAHEVGHAARHAATRRWAIEIRQGFQARQDLADFQELGAIEEDAGPDLCSQCGRPVGPTGYPCRRCGSEVGEQDGPAAPDYEDEWAAAENDAVHGDHSDDYFDDGVEPGLIETLQETLLKCGFSFEDSAESAALLLHTFQESGNPGVEQYEATLKEIDKADQYVDLLARLLSPDVAAHVIAVFSRTADLEDVKSPSRGSADITIFQDRYEIWHVEVEDLLADQVVKKPTSKIDIGGLTPTVGEYFEVQSKNSARLQLIGKVVLEHFKEEFFEQPSLSLAQDGLVAKALQQKSVARQAQMLESTLSGWCNGGVNVLTRHGLYKLGDFFRRSPTSSRGGQASKAGIVRSVIEAARQLTSEGHELIPGERISKQDNERLRTWLSANDDIHLKERAFRNYWRDAGIVRQVATAMNNLEDMDLSSADDFRNKMKEACSKKCTDKQLDNALLLAQFYRDNNWDLTLLSGGDES